MHDNDSQRPLLADGGRASYHSNSSPVGHPHSLQRRVSSLSAKSVTPLPRAQITVLMIMRFSEPLCFICIMPFIPRMLRENMPDVPPEQIGYYAGFIESVFAMVQFGTGFLWGRTSDRIGRKPVLLIGLLGVGLSMNAFGLAKTLPQMIVARSIAGLMNANISVLKSALAELTDETNQARAFSLAPICYALGAMIGPALGGFLSNPVDSFDIFRRSEFLKKYPYWLPCFCASLFNLVGIVAGLLFLKETLPTRRARRPAHVEGFEHGDGSVDGDDDTDNVADDSGIAAESDTPPTIREILTRPVIFALANSGMINFVNICYIAVLPLFCDAPVEMGGLSMSKRQIGYYLVANGVVTIVVQLLAFPRLERRWGGPLPTLRRCLLVLPGVFLSFVLAHYAARWAGKPALVAALGLLLLFRGASSMMVVSSNLCVNNVVPHHAALGSVNGLSSTLGSLARAIGPVLATSSFAFSISHLRAFLDGQAVWLFFSGVALITWWTSSHMQVPRRAAWRSKRRR